MKFVKPFASSPRHKCLSLSDFSSTAIYFALSLPVSARKKEMTDSVTAVCRAWVTFFVDRPLSPATPVRSAVGHGEDLAPLLEILQETIIQSSQQQQQQPQPTNLLLVGQARPCNPTQATTTHAGQRRQHKQQNCDGQLQQW